MKDIIRFISSDWTYFFKKCTLCCCEYKNVKSNL